MNDHFAPVIEFDCCECGRHIIHIAGPRPDPLLCNLCLILPNWFDDPELRKTFDPDGLATPRFTTQ